MLLKLFQTNSPVFEFWCCFFILSQSYFPNIFDCVQRAHTWNSKFNEISIIMFLQAITPTTRLNDFFAHKHAKISIQKWSRKCTGIKGCKKNSLNKKRKGKNRKERTYRCECLYGLSNTFGCRNISKGCTVCTPHRTLHGNLILFINNNFVKVPWKRVQHWMFQEKYDDGTSKTTTTGKKTNPKKTAKKIVET